MQKDRKQRIVEILKANDASGIKFAETKVQLLESGYTDTEIKLALYEAPYDAKPNKVPQPDPVKQHFKNNPESANRVADSLLKDLKSNERAKISANMAASQFAPGHHAKLFYSLKTADLIGYPFFTSAVFVLVTWALVMKFGLPDQLLYAVIGICGVYWAYLAVKRLK